MEDIKLNAITTPSITIINRNVPPDGQLNVELSRSFKKESSNYIGTCQIQLFFQNDINKDFFVQVEVCGNFSVNSDKINEDIFKDHILKTLLPHLNATLTAVMAISAIPPQLIPTTILADYY